MLKHENENIDEYELEALQHKVISDNIKKDAKKKPFSKRLNTAALDNNRSTSSYFKDFKNFVRPSTSAADLYQKPKLIKMKKDQSNAGPKFVSLHEHEFLKDVKSYKDIKKEIERKNATQPINFRMINYEEDQVGRATTAPDSVNGIFRAKNRQKQANTVRPGSNDDQERPENADLNSRKLHTFSSESSMGPKSSNMGHIETTLVKKQKIKPFPEDF